MSNYTKEQKEAIETLDQDVLVSAGAGSGKTRILVDRYINIIKEKMIDVDNILAITFTNKAAGEMKDRVRKAANNRIIHASSLEERKRWLKVKHDLESANIGTFHSFCSKILRENPVEAEIDPKFLVLDEAQTQLLLKREVEETVLDLMQGNNNKINSIAIEYGKDGLVNLLIDAYTEIKRSGLSLDEARDLTIESYKKSHDNFKNEKINLLKAGDDISSFDTSKIKGKTREKVETFKQLWAPVRERIVRDEIDWANEWRDISETADVLKNRVAGELKPYKDSFNEICQVVKGVIDDSLLLDNIEGLFFVLKICEENIDRRKMANSVLDYDDLEIKARKLLRNDEIARKHYREKFAYVLVDEFQDTNELQKEIIDLIRGHNLFLVGDYKQSIYGFRGAEVEVFLKSKEEIKDCGKVIPLSTNFRTQKQLLEFINELFHDTINEYDRLLTHRSNEDKSINVECLMFDENDDTAENYRMREATMIGQRIKDIIGKKVVYDENDVLRKAGYGDIAILFRAMTDVKIYEYQLRRAGIPYHVLSGRGLLDRQEIIDVMNFLKAIDNRYDCISLVGTLRSPFFGIADDVLFWATRNNTLIDLYDDILDGNDLSSIKKDMGETNLSALQNGFKIIEKYRILSSHMSISELIRKIVDELGYNITMLTKFNGEQIISNVQKLVSIASEFEQSDIFCLSDFIEYMENMVNMEVKEAEAQIQSEEGNTVKLMTVHKGKGLEFPIVIVPDISKQIKALNERVVFDKEYGLVLYGGNQGLIKEIVREHRCVKEQEESLRIFYVAVTRARDHLFLSGCLTNKSLNNPTWMQLLHRKIGYLSGIDTRSTDVEWKGQKIKVWREIVLSDDYDDYRDNKKISAIQKYPHIKPGKMYEIGKELGIQDEYGITKEITRRTGKLKQLMLPNKFSVSALMTFIICPKLYKYYYIDKIPELSRINTAPEEGSLEDLDKVWEDGDYLFLEEYGDMNLPHDGQSNCLNSAQIGTIVHKICECIRPGKEVDKLIEQALLDMSVLIKDVPEAQYEEIRSLINIYTNSPMFHEIERAEKVFSELPFTVLIKGYEITGKIDKVFLGDSITVIDFKTTNMSESDMQRYAGRYDLQLEIYALAVARLLKKNDIKTCLYYLKSNATYVKHFSSKELDRTEMRIERILQDIETSIHDQAPLNHKGNKCKNCGYSHICDAFSFT